MKAKDSDLKRLAEIILGKINEGFEEKHLTGNLMDTMEIVKTNDGYRIEIPAETYEMFYWFYYKAIVPNGKGSYASKLDKEGSAFMTYDPVTGNPIEYVKPGNHKGYVEKAISEGLEKWMAEMSSKYKFERKE